MSGRRAQHCIVRVFWYGIAGRTALQSWMLRPAHTKK